MYSHFVELGYLDDGQMSWTTTTTTPDQVLSQSLFLLKFSHDHYGRHQLNFF
jgi:hypothetical protein